MRLNLLGQAIGRGHVDGVLLPAPIGTDFCWYTNDIPIQAQGASITTLEGGIWKVQANHGANWLRAGKGRWFAFYSGTTDDLVPADVDPYTGTAVFTRMSTGRDIILLEMNGNKTTINTGVIGTAMAARNVRQRAGWLLYEEDNVWRLMSAPAGAYTSIADRVEDVDYAVPVPFDGRVLLLERSNGRLTLRYPDSTTGWFVHEDPASDGLVAPDALEIGGKVRVAWSNKQSEAADVFQFRDMVIDPNTQIDLNDQPVDVPDYERSVPHFAYYTYDAGRQYGNHPDAVLHIAWCSGDYELDVQQANLNNQYVITSRELIGLAKNKALIIVANDFAGAAPIQEQVNAAIPLCVAYNIRMVVYDEKQEKPTLPTWAISQVRCFREPDETIGDWKKRAQQLIDTAPTQDVCLLLGIDDRRAQLTWQILRETALAATEIIRANKRVKLASWFSYARTAIDASGQHVPPGGAILYPDVWEVVLASKDASYPYNPKDFQLPQTPPDGGGGGGPVPIPTLKIPKGRLTMPADEVRGWLFDLAGANYFVDPGKPGQLQKHAVGQQPNPDWSGWEAVKLGETGADGRRAVVFTEAKQRLSEDDNGKAVVKNLDWNGDWELFMSADQPKDWAVTLVFRPHGDAIKAVYVFKKAK